MSQGVLRQAAELAAKYALLEARLKIARLKERKTALIKGAVFILLSGIFWVHAVFILSSSLFLSLAGFSELVLPALWSAAANIALGLLLLLLGMNAISD